MINVKTYTYVASWNCSVDGEDYSTEVGGIEDGYATIDAYGDALPKMKAYCEKVEDDPNAEWVDDHELIGQSSATDVIDGTVVAVLVSKYSNDDDTEKQPVCIIFEGPFNAPVVVE